MVRPNEHMPDVGMQVGIERGWLKTKGVKPIIAVLIKDDLLAREGENPLPQVLGEH
jgi:hypothetical protein